MPTRTPRRCPTPAKLVFNTADAAAVYAGGAVGRVLWVYKCRCRAGHWHLTTRPPWV